MSRHYSWSNHQYLTSNIWPTDYTKTHIDKYCLDYIPNVEIQDLISPHVLAGQQGLFALIDFEICDIIGSYMGRYVDSDVRGYPNMSQIKSGCYLATIDVVNYSLGINAEDCGNEMRFINSYLNISHGPNVVMRTTFVNRLPHIFIVCCKPIKAGEEILLDYGNEYNQRYLIPKRYISDSISTTSLFQALPGCVSDNELESGDEC